MSSLVTCRREFASVLRTADSSVHIQLRGSPASDDSIPLSGSRLLRVLLRHNAYGGDPADIVGMITC
jgi:hypothetical protein